MFLKLASTVDNNSSAAVSELAQRAEEVKESDGFDLLNQILAVKTRKASKNGGQTDRSLRS